MLKAKRVMILYAFIGIVSLGCKANPNELLFSACHTGNLQEAKKAIESGANVNQKSDLDESTTPLLSCVGNGHYNIANLLIDHGAKLEIDGDDCRAVLMYVQGPKNTEIRKFLDGACQKEKANKRKS